jgi:hypothetical protein
MSRASRSMLPEPGHRHAAEPRRLHQDLERANGGVVGEPFVAARVLGQRRVGEVDHVDVEVDEHPLGATVEQLEGARRRRGGVGADLLDRHDVDRAPLYRLALMRLGLLGAPSEQHHPVGLEQRSRGADLDELAFGVGLAEHVGEAHPVERAGEHAHGHVEIGVEVEVNDPNALPGLDVSRHRPDSNRAIAAQYERGLAGAGRLGDTARRIGDDLDNPVEVLRPRVAAVGSPPPPLAVAAVVHLEAGVSKQIDQAGVAQRGRGLLLARRERAGARRDADHTERAHDRRFYGDLTP